MQRVGWLRVRAELCLAPAVQEGRAAREMCRRAAGDGSGGTRQRQQQRQRGGFTIRHCTAISLSPGQSRRARKRTAAGGEPQVAGTSSSRWIVVLYEYQEIMWELFKQHMSTEVELTACMMPQLGTLPPRTPTAAHIAELGWAEEKAFGEHLHCLQVGRCNAKFHTPGCDPRAKHTHAFQGSPPRSLAQLPSVV